MVFEDDKCCFDSELLHYIILKKNKKAHSMVQGCQPAELRDSTGSTLLHYSAQHGNTEMTEYFIERGCEIEAKNNDEFTPLMLAVKNRHLKTVKFLLEAGANIYPSKRSAGILLKDVVVWISFILLKDVARDVFGWISLEDDFDEDFHPIRRGVLEPILQKIKENLESSDDQAIAKLLLESDCPLHHVICTLKDTEFTRYYLANGYSVDAQERTRGRTPLFMAVSVGDLANVEVLLEHGANVNVQDYEGKNILCFYAGSRLLSTEKLEILRILMKSGASLSSLDVYGVSVAEILFSNGQKEVVNIVLPYADLRAEYGSQKNTVLHALVQNNNTRDIQLHKIFSEQYFDVNAVNIGGVTALQSAIYLKKSPVMMIDFMLQKGADISTFCTKVTTLKNIINRSWPDDNSTCVKIIELFFLYGVDLRKVLSTIKTTLNHQDFDKSSLAKLLIAHIVLLEEGGQSFRELFVPNVEARPVLMKLFEKYKLQIEEMKKIKVYESITMLDLVATDEKKLIHYAANEDLISNFEVLSQNSSRSGWYYKCVKKRIARAVDVKKCQRKASLIISDLTGIQQQLILDKIVDYLRVSDFNGLFLV